jgi:Uncharacterized conserved protein
MSLDAVELLMIEHMQCKSVRETQLDHPDFEKFQKFHTFLKNVHIEVEEKVVFPDLVEPLWDDSKSFSETVRRTASDHKLLDTLAKNMIKWNESEQQERYLERLPLYYKLLVEHNEKEESDLFVRWKNVDKRVYTEASREILNIIEDFGIEKYRMTMNLTESAFAYFLNKV